MVASNPRYTLLLSILAFGTNALSQPPLPPPDEPEAKKAEPQPGVRVADKGPIHEAFAQPGADVRGKDMTAPKAPPAAIVEVPPDTKPEGANVKWIPGYWQWDEAKSDFIWVSGFYRNVPPNREWHPGKWIEKDGKNVYTPGYWQPTDGTKVPTGLPEPPKSIESGPSTPNDNPDAMWVPGGWEYRGGQFVWRAGYWAAPYRQMMWQPNQYVYNGSGYSQVPGYWDYPLEQRGLLYAPVYIDPKIVVNPNWSFTPQYGIGMGDGNDWGNGGVFSQMYYGPNYNNYYYGSGYGDPYGLGGFGFGLGYTDPLFGYGGYYPWWYGGIGFYNPLWRHYNWLNRGNGNYAGNVRSGNRGTSAGRGSTAVNGRGSVTRANPTPARSVGTVGGTAGVAARQAAQGAVASNATQVVRPASQVLATQSSRTLSTPLRSLGSSASGSGSSMGQTRAYTGVAAGGTVAQPGGWFGNSSYRGYASEPILRGAGGYESHGSYGFQNSSANGFGSSYHNGVSSGGGYHSSGAGGFHSSGGGGRGGHR